jgi:hypothetical protein
MKILNSFLIILAIALLPTRTNADKCADYILLDGTETLVQYGMDTTCHWWAVTSPFTDKYRVIIDGEESEVFDKVSDLTFSPDGVGWAYFGRTSTQWNIVTNRKTIPLQSSTPGEIAFSPDGKMVYSYMEGELETIINGDRKLEVYHRSGNIYVSHGARRIAFLGRRSNSWIINIDGKESSLFDKIIPIGFWQDGQMVYAAGSVGNMEIYRGRRTISEPFADIHEAQINRSGSVASAIVEYSSGEYAGIVISDEYYEPLVSRRYDKAFNMALHPRLAMLAFNAIEDRANVVVMNTAEYSAGEVTGRPRFTHDGRDLFYIGCDDIDCFVGVNGRQHPVYSQLNVRAQYAMKPQSQSIAYTTGSNMVVRDLQSKQMFAGMMVDRTRPPQYNWREGSYEALGSIGNRLYLLTCVY